MSEDEKKLKMERDALAPIGKTLHGEHGYVIDKPAESKYRAFRSQTSPLGRMDVDVKYTMRDKQAAFDIAKDKIEGQKGVKPDSPAPVSFHTQTYIYASIRIPTYTFVYLYLRLSAFVMWRGCPERRRACGGARRRGWGELCVFRFFRYGGRK